MEGRFYCYGCGLWYGEPDAPLLPSQLCGSCSPVKRARAQEPIKAPAPELDEE